MSERGVWWSTQGEMTVAAFAAATMSTGSNSVRRRRQHPPFDYLTRFTDPTFSKVPSPKVTLLEFLLQGRKEVRSAAPCQTA